MAKITAEARELFNTKAEPYRTLISGILQNEKEILTLIERESFGTSYKKLILCEEMIYIATIQVLINNLSLLILGTKNTDALNDGRKMLYKAIIYLEECVTPLIDAPFSEYEDRVSEIANMPIEKRYYLVRKLGLAIQLIIDGFGDNTKWKWSFVELQGRFAVVSKNLIDLKQASKDYFDPRSLDYDTTVMFIRLVKKLLSQAGEKYRDRYELSTHRIDDMRIAISLVLALRRLCIIINDVDEAEELKKKAAVWNDRLEKDRSKGVCQ
ncbi:MAG TPA: hypothetical protein IAA30_10290 [Candidatus Treponema faecavium]|nr:hypothetical protein [Candidatus Treponema faecavium]